MSVKHSRLTGAFALLLFICLAYALSTNQTGAFDSTVRQAVHSFAAPALTRVMLALTFIGTTRFIAVVDAAFVWWLMKTGRRLDALWLIAVPVTGDILLQILKFVFHRARPEPFFGLAKPGSYSFPSGHALLATIFYLSLAILMTRNRVIRIAAVLLALLIGLSRVYLGVHYPTDVLAGFAAGIFWLSAWRQFSEGFSTWSMT